MAASPPDSLPSTVEETLAPCTRFRILVVGNSGVGKSSLIANVFNIDQKDIDIADNRAGTADIHREYTSVDNPHFILHDSQGFEPGNKDNWDTVEQFISDRSKITLSVKDRLHVIWMCMEAPRTGCRLTETANEALVVLARRFNIPVVFVLTKSDLLFNECFQKATRHLEAGADTSEFRIQALNDSAKHLKASIQELQEKNDEISKLPLLRLPLWRRHPQSSNIIKHHLWSRVWIKSLPRHYVAVSTNDRFPNSLEALENLTKITRKCLKTTETLVPWAVAQRIDPKQKVDTSIEEGFKKYWKDLGKSTVFRGHVLLDCLWRIHLDIIKVWNFRDPQKLLSGNIFRLKMLELIQPFMPQPSALSSINERFPALETLSSIFDSIFPLASMALEATSLTIVAIEFLFATYQAVPRIATCIEAYIVHLTLFLYDLFVATLKTERQKPLTGEVISKALEDYRRTRSERIHTLVRDNTHSTWDAFCQQKNKCDIGHLIRHELGMDIGCTEQDES